MSGGGRSLRSERPRRACEAPGKIEYKPAIGRKLRGAGLFRETWGGSHNSCVTSGAVKKSKESVGRLAGAERPTPLFGGLGPGILRIGFGA